MREIKFRAYSTVSNRMMDWAELKKLFVNTWLGVEPVKVMQYTGLKDKNGVEIYEGDICTIKDSEGQVWDAPIEYIEGYFCFHSNYDSILNQSYTSRLEVIGNIYENPDLLERSK